MRRSAPSFALVAAALALAAPAPAQAKGYAAAFLCGQTACRPVDRAAVRAGFDDVTSAPGPTEAEPFFTIHLRARVSSGRVAEVYELAWLPRAGLARGDGERRWVHPGPVLDRALRRAAAGLEPRPAAALGPIDDGAPQARVVEVFSPARDHDGHPATRVIAAIAAGLLAAGALAMAARLRTGCERQPARLRIRSR